MNTGLFLRHVKAARIPLLIAVAGLVLTIWVDQIRELYFLLAAAHGELGVKVGAAPTTLLLGVSVWHSARSVDRVRVPAMRALGEPAGEASRSWLPRILGASVPALMFAGVVEALNDRGLGEDAAQVSWTMPVLFALTAAGLFALFVVRRRIGRRLGFLWAAKPSTDPVVSDWSELPPYVRRINRAVTLANVAALERVPLRLGDMLYEPDQRQSHAYFPVSVVVSLHYGMDSGAAAETAAVGNEGVVGVTLFMHGESTAGSAVVQIAGEAYRLGAAALKREFDRAGAMQRLSLRYMQALVAQTTQTAVCNRHHSVEQQLCRWLLGILDRVPSGEVVVTQEMIAGVLGELGVRRESITEAAGALQRAGLIRNRRGHITVLARGGLEQTACECHDIVAAESRRLLPARLLQTRA